MSLLEPRLNVSHIKIKSKSKRDITRHAEGLKFLISQKIITSGEEVGKLDFSYTDM